MCRYQQLLNDCHQCYFQQRLTLLAPSVASAVTELATKHSRDHCALVSNRIQFAPSGLGVYYCFSTICTGLLSYSIVPERL